MVSFWVVHEMQGRESPKGFVLPGQKAKKRIVPADAVESHAYQTELIQDQ